MLSSVFGKFDVIILSETWMYIELNDILNGYCSINSLGELNKNDSVTIFSKNIFLLSQAFKKK